jgi:23S rRNA (cytosine1962-C5)-methyltransferase
MTEIITGTITLKPGREKPVHNRHPWVFSGAISRADATINPGDLVQVLDNNGRYLATAYFNPHSQIQARILTWELETEFTPDFWRQRLQQAIAGRTALQLASHNNAYRLVNGEADGLPGLIVDQYADYLVIQCLTLGIDRRKELIVQLLVELCHPLGIIERSDVPVRKKEGLRPTAGVIWGQTPPNPLIIEENGYKFYVDLMTGQKTGFYLDQRDNRTAVCQPSHVQGKEILNVFAYSGAFSVYAAAHSAHTITNIDSSIEALTLAEQNMALNDMERPSDEYIAGDAFEILRYYRDENRTFDMVILDPPKFANSQRDVDHACRGYKDLNWLALRLLRPGGLLATFSCSGLITADLFQKVVFGAAVDAQRDVQIIQQLAQASDHPILLAFPESAYLKGLLCRVW